MPRKKTARRSARAPAKKPARRGKRYVCPDCGFVAAHAMGLGRHRSARHGVMSKRQSMQRDTGAWLTRQQAAKRAKVHYNTIRQWERSGLVRSRRQGRAVLIDAQTLSRATGAPAGVDARAGLDDLERVYVELRAGLKRMLDAADASLAALAKAKRKR